MKKPILSLLLGMAISSAASAQNCKYVKDDTDPFNNKTAHTATMAIGLGIAGWEVILQEIGGQHSLGLRIVYQGNVDKPYEKGQKVYFKLSDGETVELTAKKRYDPVPFKMYDNPFTQWLVKEDVPLAIFKKFGAGKITAVKVTIGGNDFLLPKINDRQTTKIMETAACMLEHYQ